MNPSARRRRGAQRAQTGRRVFSSHGIRVCFKEDVMVKVSPENDEESAVQTGRRWIPGRRNSP